MTPAEPPPRPPSAAPRFRAESRVVGFDDAPFQRGDARVPVVGVVMPGGSYVEAVLRTDVAGDGDDATQRLAEAVRTCRQAQNLTAILLQNWTVAGFNVVDLDALHAATGLPVLTVARGAPDLAAVEAALLGGRVPGGPAKWARVAALRDRIHLLDDPPRTVVPVGLSLDEAHALLKTTTLRGSMPEPLRLAHLIGAGWVLGWSRGQ